MKPLEEARRRSVHPHRARRHQSISEAFMRCLEDLVRARPGYQQFYDARGSALQNPQIIATWKFAVDFKNDYYNKQASMICDESPV